MHLLASCCPSCGAHDSCVRVLLTTSRVVAAQRGLQQASPPQLAPEGWDDCWCCLWRWGGACGSGGRASVQARPRTPCMSPAACGPTCLLLQCCSSTCPALPAAAGAGQRPLCSRRARWPTRARLRMQARRWRCCCCCCPLRASSAAAATQPCGRGIEGVAKLPSLLRRATCIAMQQWGPPLLGGRAVLPARSQWQFWCAEQRVTRVVVSCGRTRQTELRVLQWLAQAQEKEFCVHVPRAGLQLRTSTCGCTAAAAPVLP